MSKLQKELRKFLERYIDDPETCKKAKKDIVTEYDIEGSIAFAISDHVEQEIIDYGTAHPEVPFWDFDRFIKPGLKDGITEEDLLRDDD